MNNNFFCAVKLERLYVALAFIALSLAAICTFVMHVGLDHAKVLTIIVTAAVMGICFLLYSDKDHLFAGRKIGQETSISKICGYLTVFTSGAIIVYIYWNGGTLPADDPVAIPTFAQVIGNNQTLVEFYPKGVSGHSYPPGAPILYSYMLSWLSPINALLAFKLINLTALWLIPLTWAWVWNKYLPINISMGAWVSICYLAFWGIDQTIGFAFPFAGKNALIIGLFLVPAFVDMMISFCKTKYLWILVPIPFFGVVLINYSLLHVAVTLLFVFLVFDIFNFRKNLRIYFKLAYAVIATAFLIYTILSEAVSDPRAGSIAFAPIRGLSSAFENYVSRSSSVVIYNDADFGLPHSYFRGLFFIYFWVVAMAASYVMFKKNTRKALLASFFAVILILSFGFNALPAAMTLDYARWILWPVQAVSYAIVFACMWELLHSTKNNSVKLSLSGSFILLGVFWINNICSSVQVFKGVVDSQAVSRDQLMGLRAELNSYASADGCILLSESTLSSDKLSVSQNSQIYKYAEIVSKCKFGNGSWVNVGSADLRTLDGFPSLERLQDLMRTSEVVVVGNTKRILNYIDILNRLDGGITYRTLKDNGVGSSVALKSININNP